MPIQEEALVRLLLQERTRLLAYVRAVVRDEHLAEDVFQEAAALAVRERERIQDRDHFLLWMRKTARYRALNALRQRQRLVFNDELLDQLEAEWTQADAVPDSQRADALRHCMDQLTPNNQNILRLRYGEGLSGLRLAAALNRQLNAVYVALARIHKALGECIRRRLEGELAHGG